MHRISLIALFAAALLVGLPAAVDAQVAPQWRPPSTQMPAMPSASSLRGDWRGELGGWIRDVDSVAGVEASGLRATGSPGGSGGKVQLLRLMSGPVPVVVWTDRNGDGTADMIEIYRSGTLVVQMIDADYNGRGNVIRFYDAAGALIREDRL